MATSCKSCDSGKLFEFTTELNIHLPWERSASQPSVFAYPKAVICLDCGFLECLLSQAELQTLNEAQGQMRTVAR